MKTQEQSLSEIGQSAYESIKEMVEAADCDYDRLEEMREEREDWVDNVGGDDDEQDRSNEEWAKEFPDEAGELANLETEAGDCEDQDDAEQRITDDPLSLQFRSGWYSQGDTPTTEEFELLLSTGGPATRIIGRIEDGEPVSARLQAQDWGTPWTEYLDADQDVLLSYCRRFYFGE